MENGLTFSMNARQKMGFEMGMMLFNINVIGNCKTSRVGRTGACTYSFVKTDYWPQATAQRAAAAQTATEQPFYIDREILS